MADIEPTAKDWQRDAQEDRKRILSLSGRELDAEIERSVFRREVGHRWTVFMGGADNSDPDEYCSLCQLGRFWRQKKEEYEVCPKAARPFSSDYNAVHAMEEEIYRRQLHQRYALELKRLVCQHNDFGLNREELYQLIHASAADRCRAALPVCQEKPGSGLPLRAQGGDR